MLFVRLGVARLLVLLILLLRVLRVTGAGDFGVALVPCWGFVKRH